MTPNGCGAEGSRIDPPDLVFKRACNTHDSLYNVGVPKDVADSTFLVRMNEAVAKAPFWSRPLLAPVSALYFLGVRLFGGGAYRRARPRTLK